MDENKKHGILMPVLLVIVLIAVIGSLGVSSLTLLKITRQEQAVEEEKITKENDVVIADVYTIKSTEHISNAYKTGDTSGLSDKDRETLDMASAALNEFLQDGMSDYEKEKAAYEWITSNLGQDKGVLTVVPSSGQDSDNPYGALKYHNAVCVGYATTFRLFMEMMDIPCMVVHESGKYHSWDLVQIKGDWYHVDCYSAANTNSYQYFNMMDSMVSYNWDKDFFPAANSVKLNYAYQNAEKLGDIFKIPGKLRKAMDDGKTHLSFLFPLSLSNTEAELANTMLSQIEGSLWSTQDYSQVYFIWNWYPTDEGYLYSISINGTEENSTENASPDQINKANNALHGAFDDIAEIEDISVNGPQEETSLIDDIIKDPGATIGNMAGEAAGNLIDEKIVTPLEDAATNFITDTTQNLINGAVDFFTGGAATEDSGATGGNN